MAARSPACVMAGPLVSRNGAVISLAMIMASVVLPRPGGPESSTWSGARPRRRAASSTSPSWARTRDCPTTSSRVRGRRAASTARSSPSASAAVSERRCCSSAAPRWSSYTGSGLAQGAEGGAQQGRHVGDVTGLGRDRVDGLLGVARRPAQPHQPLVHLVTPRCRSDGSGTRAPTTDRGAEPVLELEDDPLGALLPDAGHPGQGLHVVAGDGAAQVVGAEHRDHRLRQLGPDAGGRLHQLEAGLLVLVEEAEEGQGVLPDHHAGGQRGLLAGAQRGERAGGAHELEAHSPDLQHGAGQGHGGDLAADEGDHLRMLLCCWAVAAASAASMRACAPPRQMWVMASASASAASAGFGGASSRRIRVTIAPTWALSARPLPDTAAFTSLGVWSAMGRPRRAAATIAIPLAWAVPMIVLESERAKTRSTATASGRCSSIQASRPFSMVTSRWAIGRSALVRITPTSTIVSGRPTLPSTTPTPHLVRPGSMPSTRTRFPFADVPSEH